MEEKKNDEIPQKIQNQKTVAVEFRSKKSGKLYAGDFTFKRLTLGDMAKVGVIKAQLNGGLLDGAVDETTDKINGCLAHMTVGIVKHPEWWAPSDLYDFDLFWHINDKLQEFENSFRTPPSGGVPTNP